MGKNGIQWDNAGYFAIWWFFSMRTLACFFQYPSIVIPVKMGIQDKRCHAELISASSNSNFVAFFGAAGGATFGTAWGGFVIVAEQTVEQLLLVVDGVFPQKAAGP